MARGDLEITGYIDDDDGVPTRPTVSEDQIKIIVQRQQKKKVA